jgi:hypothetical protein
VCIRLVSRFIDARTLSLLDLEKVADLLDAKVVSGDFGLNANGSPCGTVTLSIATPHAISNANDAEALASSV